MDLMDYYDVFDAMEEQSDYIHPDKDYFPTTAEINTYAMSDKYPGMLPFLLWLDSNLSPDGVKEHAEAVNRLREIVDEKEAEEEEEEG